MDKSTPEQQAARTDEGTRAEIGDPFWMLGRQWQLGEFRGSNGGSPLSVTATHRSLEFESGDGRVPANAGIEAAVECAAPAWDDGAVPDWADDEQYMDDWLPACVLAAPPGRWKAERLEYEASLEHGGTDLIAGAYTGDALDWYAFRRRSLATGDFGPPTEKSYPAVSVTFPGMPKQRFWEFEDSDVDLGSGGSRPGNFLELLLMEFGLLYSNDWFIVPLPQKANTVRWIQQVVVQDVFGPRPVEPHETAEAFGFQHFALDPVRGETDTAVLAGLSSSAFHLLPATNPTIHTGEPIEKAIFFRDEMANLAWALERCANGARIEADAGDDGAVYTRAEPGTQVRRYEPLHVPPRRYIPYLPIRIDEHGSMALRRARTSADPFSPQYQTRIVTDSPLVREEHVPAQPIVVSQHARLACVGSDDREQVARFKYFLWVGRRKGLSPQEQHPELRFDTLV